MEKCPEVVKILIIYQTVKFILPFETLQFLKCCAKVSSQVIDNIH